MAWQRALELLRAVEEPSARDFGRCISACAKEVCWQVSLQLFQDASAYQRDVVIASSVVSACGKASMWSLALDLVQRCLAARLQADTTFFNTAISCTKSWRHSLQTLETMTLHEISADPITLNSLLKALGQRWELSLALQSHLKLPLDLVGCNTLLRYLPWPMALELLADMPRRRLAPDLVAVNAAIRACAGAWRHAVALLPTDGLGCAAAVKACQEAMLWQRCVVTRTAGRGVKAKALGLGSSLFLGAP